MRETAPDTTISALTAARNEPIEKATKVIGVRVPDSLLAREAVDLARAVSSPALFNHVMRSYCFAELLAAPVSGKLDREVLFLSSVMHDLGLTDHAVGDRRFEIEGADAAYAFLTDRGVPEDRAWTVWDAIALHTTDLNMHRQQEARTFQSGVLADVVGAGLERIGPSKLEEVVRAFPRLDFKREFIKALRREAECKPLAFAFHPSLMIAHHCLGGISIPDARPMVLCAPFDE